MTDVMTKIAAPSADYFEVDDRLTSNTKAVLDTDPNSETYGKLQFVLAPWGRCILDGGSDCWTISELKDEDPDLNFAHQGDVELDDGSILKIANLGGDAGHAPGAMTAGQARDYYGNTSLQVARVRYAWNDKLGLVGSGVVWPDVLENKLAQAKIMASSTSLDARYIQDEKKYRLVGACMVSIPGLPLRRASLIHLRDNEYYGIHHPIIFAHANGAEMTITADSTPAQAIAEKYNEESKRLSEEATVKRKAIADKYRAENMALTKRVKKAEDRVQQRQALSDRKSAELQALREEIKAKRSAIRERQAAETRALQDRQRSERDNLRDTQRSQRDELKNRTRSAAMNTLIVPGTEGDVFLPGDPYSDGRIVDNCELLADGTWLLSFAEDAPTPDDAVQLDVEPVAAEATCDCQKVAAPAADEMATDDPTVSEPSPDTPLTWADVPQIIDMAVNAYNQTNAEAEVTASFERMLNALPINAEAMLYKQVPKSGFEVNEVVVWKGGEAIVCDTAKGADGEPMIIIAPIIEGRRTRNEDLTVPVADVRSTGMVARWDWQDDADIILPPDSAPETPAPVDNPVAVDPNTVPAA